MQHAPVVIRLDGVVVGTLHLGQALVRPSRRHLVAERRRGEKRHLRWVPRVGTDARDAERDNGQTLPSVNHGSRLLSCSLRGQAGSIDQKHMLCGKCPCEDARQIVLDHIGPECGLMEKHTLEKVKK